jgi:hypothetical protein
MLNKYTVQLVAIICISSVIVYVVYTLGADSSDAKKSIVSDIVMFGMAAFGVAKVAEQPKPEPTGDENDTGHTNG